MKEILKHYTIRNAHNEHMTVSAIITELNPATIHLHINPNLFIHTDQLPQYDLEGFIDPSYEEYAPYGDDPGDPDMMDFLTAEAADEINRETDLWLEEEKEKFATTIQQQLRNENAIASWTEINIVWSEKSAHYEPLDFSFFY